MRRSIWWILGLVLASFAGAMLAKGVAPPNLEKALLAQWELHRQFPQNSDIANDLGNLLLLAGRVKDAEKAYRIAVENSADNSIPRYNLGLLFQQQGHRDEALKEFQNVLVKEPDHAWSHYQVGALYEGMGEKSRAIRAYANAFILDPDLASSSVNPQVIESKLVVEAMLLGFRETERQPLAPKAYDDPRRIADLMIASPLTAHGDAEFEFLEEDTFPSEDEDLSPSPEKRSQGRLAAGEEEGSDLVEEELEASRQDREATEEGSRRILSPNNIELGGSLGQVSSGGTASRRSSSRGTPRSGTSPSRRGAAANSGSSSDRGFRTPRSGASTGRGRPGRVRYIPPGASTSSLELEWLGAAERQPAPAG